MLHSKPRFSEQIMKILFQMKYKHIMVSSKLHSKNLTENSDEERLLYKKKETFLFSCLKRLKRVLRKLRFWETV